MNVAELLVTDVLVYEHVNQHLTLTQKLLANCDGTLGDVWKDLTTEERSYLTKCLLAKLHGSS